MKYYIIVGEASGDLHASRLMSSLKIQDNEAQFRFVGGDLMASVGGTLVKHYRNMAYMGFVPVLLHLRTIFANMAFCKRDIVEWHPDALILVDYPGFNLDIAKYIHSETDIPVYYYISPKIWAWKEWRIKAIKRDISALFSILPFEVPFFKQKHGYPVHYVGNPTADEVRTFMRENSETEDDFIGRNNLETGKPIIALLAGSRKQEIKDNLPMMIRVASQFSGYQMVLAGAPSIDNGYYDRFVAGTDAHVVYNDTYALLSHSSCALVTSGTATLETALFGVPQVVCYKTPLPHLMRWAFNNILKVRYISLVNLIADKEIVPELFADRFTFADITSRLAAILPGGSGRQAMLDGYAEVKGRLGNAVAPDNAAKIMVGMLDKKMLKR